MRVFRKYSIKHGTKEVINMKNKIASCDVPLPASGNILITRKNRIGAYYGLQHMREIIQKNKGTFSTVSTIDEIIR